MGFSSGFSFRLDANHQLYFTGHAKKKGEKGLIGTVSDTNPYTLRKWLASELRLGKRSVYLTSEQAQSLKEKVISYSSSSPKKRAEAALIFQGLFSKAHLSDREITGAVEAIAGMDTFATKMASLTKKSVSAFSAEDCATVFMAEHQAKSFLEIAKQSGLPEMEWDANFYQNKVLPLVKKAKEAISSRPMLLSVSAAAAKGRALQAGLQTIVRWEQGKTPSEPQQVDKAFLFPASGAVFKTGTPQAEEEERQIDALMNLSVKEGSLPFFFFSGISSKRFGVAAEAVSGKSASPSPFSEGRAKPFIPGMLTFDDFANAPKKFYQTVAGQLDPQSEIRALLTAEFQFLDLHKGNLAIVPKLSEEHRYFRDCTFSYGLKSNVPFPTFMKEFLSGYIRPETRVAFTSSDRQMTSAGYQSLSDIPHLLDALNSQWEVVLFDADRVLAESNQIHLQKRDGTLESLLPFRSAFLSIDWKDRPLSDQTLTFLRDPARSQRIKDWIERKDAPIRQWMKHPEQIDALMKPLIEQEKFTLSYHRRKEKAARVESLRKAFCEELCSIDRYPELWRAIQGQLADRGWFTRIAKKGEAWADFANRHHVSTDLLYMLNEGLDQALPLPAKREVRIKEDLTSRSASAELQRKKIAAQFFPRLSWKQRNALYERLDRRNEYLRHADRLKNISLYSETFLKEIERIVESPSTPLDSFSKKELLLSIGGLKTDANPQAFDSLLRALRDIFTPTYFRVSCAMYPLLADAFALNLETFQNNHESAGLSIGLYSNPLEQTIAYGRSLNLKSSSKFNALAQRLEKEVGDAKLGSAPFFGSWEEEKEGSTKAR